MSSTAPGSKRTNSSKRRTGGNRVALSLSQVCVSAADAVGAANRMRGVIAPNTTRSFAGVRGLSRNAGERPGIEGESTRRGTVRRPCFRGSRAPVRWPPGPRKGKCPRWPGVSLTSDGAKAYASSSPVGIPSSASWCYSRWAGDVSFWSANAIACGGCAAFSRIRRFPTIVNGVEGGAGGCLASPRTGGREKALGATVAALPELAPERVMGGQPAYSLGPHSVRPLRRLAGGRAPSDPGRSSPLRQRARLGSSPGTSAWPSIHAASRRMFSRRPAITAGRGRRFRMNLRCDRRQRGRRCRRIGAGPPGLRDGLRPSLRRGRAPSQPGKARVVRGVTRPGTFAGREP